MDPRAGAQQHDRHNAIRSETQLPAKYRVLTISSRHIGSAGLYAMLLNEQQVDVVARVSGAPGAIEAVEKLEPEVVFVPSDVDEMSVVELAKALHQMPVHCKVGVFSQAVDHDLELALGREEVDSYILWDDVDAEILDICLRAYRKNLRVTCVKAANELFAGPERRQRLRESGIRFDARELGLINARLGPASAQDGHTIPTVEQDGPAIGDMIPDICAIPINGSKEVSLRQAGTCSTLVVFLSPMCESCQHVVESLNHLVSSSNRSIDPVGIMRADDPACRAFTSVFQPQFPVICDGTREITWGFDVHRNPFGLLYGKDGALERKGTLLGDQYLAALLGDEAVPNEYWDHVFPPKATPRAVNSAETVRAAGV